MPGPKISVEDRLEIQELFAYYAWGLNTGDAEQVLACFAQDCEFEHLPQGVFHGHDQLRVLLDHELTALCSSLRAAQAGWAVAPLSHRIEVMLRWADELPPAPLVRPTMPPSPPGISDSTTESDIPEISSFEQERK